MTLDKYIEDGCKKPFVIECDKFYQLLYILIYILINKLNFKFKI